MSQTFSGEPIFKAAAAADVAGSVSGSGQSGVSWAAIFAGGVAAAALTIMLLIFGAGLGLTAVSPWPHDGVSAVTFTVLAAIWLVLVQWVSSFFGGYLAGRLRTRWVGLHTGEVFFRDTAHGFMAWGLSTILITAVLALASHSAASIGAQAASQSELGASASSYYVDLLFRQYANPNGASMLGGAASAAPAGLPDKELREQAGTILAEATATGRLTAQDNAYLTQLVSARTGLPPMDAQARVNDVMAREQAAIAQTRQVADEARKASAKAAIFTAISLLIGAFIASVAGAVGGRERDSF